MIVAVRPIERHRIIVRAVDNAPGSSLAVQIRAPLILRFLTSFSSVVQTWIAVM